MNVKKSKTEAFTEVSKQFTILAFGYIGFYLGETGQIIFPTVAKVIGVILIICGHTPMVSAYLREKFSK